MPPTFWKWWCVKSKEALYLLFDTAPVARIDKPAYNMILQPFIPYRKLIKELASWCLSLVQVLLFVNEFAMTWAMVRGAAAAKPRMTVSWFGSLQFSLKSKKEEWNSNFMCYCYWNSNVSPGFETIRLRILRFQDTSNDFQSYDKNCMGRN